jgi:hypothetical protein
MLLKPPCTGGFYFALVLSARAYPANTCGEFAITEVSTCTRVFERAVGPGTG